MLFRVYKCSNAMELCRLAHEQGFPSLWMPVQRVKVLRRPIGRHPYYEIVERAAVTGYVYIPVDNDEDFRRWCPAKYNPKQMWEYSSSNKTTMQHIMHTKPTEIELKELLKHEHAVINSYSPTTVANGDGKGLTVGDNVEFEIAGYAVRGVLANFKKGQSVRVEVDNQLITVKLNKLNRI